MKLPQISGKELIKKNPNHQNLKRGTLHQIIKSAELTPEEIFS